jgi:hypothetical protein
MAETGAQGVGKFKKLPFWMWGSVVGREGGRHVLAQQQHDGWMKPFSLFTVTWMIITCWTLRARGMMDIPRLCCFMFSTLLEMAKERVRKGGEGKLRMDGW